MGKNIAVEGMELEFTGVTNPVWQVQTQPSDKVTASGKGVYFGTIVVALQGGQYGSNSFVSAQPHQLQPTATKCKNQQGAVLLEGDQASANVVWQPPGSSSPVTIPITCIVKKAGQEKVQAS